MTQKNKRENFLAKFIAERVDCQKHAPWFLNVAQLLGVVNDNVFKLLIAYLFIDLKGVEHSSEILFWVGTIYVVPFLLFSNAAGVLADRFSKSKMIVFLKLTEVVIMVFGVFAFWFKSEFSSYTLLFFLSVQSAFFGPPKYSVIPELVDKKFISKANGLITSFTYLAMIFGTFLASFLTQITHKNFVLTAIVCVVIAIIGYVASLGIPETPARDNHKRINPLFVYEIYKTLKSCIGRQNLLMAIFGSAFFLYIGAFFQLNVIPFAIQSLGLSEVGGGYLFLTTAIGIAGGAYLAGKLCKSRIEIGIPCISILFMIIAIFVLSFSHTHLPVVITCLVIIGFTGGMFIVPFDSYIQTYSPDLQRGQIVAAANFMSFVGVLLAPISLRVFNGTFGFTAASSFMIVGFIVIVTAVFIIRRLRGFFFSYVAKIILKPMHKITAENFPLEPKKPLILVSKPLNKIQFLALIALDRHIFLYFTRAKKRWYDPFLFYLTTLHPIYAQDTSNLIRAYARSYKPNQIACLVTDDTNLEGLGDKYQVVSLKWDVEKKDRRRLIRKRLISLSVT
ncbi:MAG: Lysophospholipid transporter LplT [Chlamydiia bacterium]|nr:Lysophospholipid transporter LplT [Chlamydiia bacterium]MCH9616368.1 Lysophospholipid transporter LplT [Chlamydiia bacterium]MCH9629646.1 Lysophospholipid transporter LplT [Chlamydiia bacterium]